MTWLRITFENDGRDRVDDHLCLDLSPSQLCPIPLNPFPGLSHYLDRDLGGDLDATNPHRGLTGDDEIRALAALLAMDGEDCTLPGWDTSAR